MQKIILTFCLAIISNQVCAQPMPVKSTTPFSTEKGTIYMNLLHASGDDVYSLKVQNNLKKTTVTYSLCKFNGSMLPVYETSLNKHIGDRFFQGVLVMKGRFYLFTFDVSNKAKKYTLYGIELDKNSGNAIGEEKKIQDYEMHSKWDAYTPRIVPDTDSSRFIITAVNDNKEDDIYYTTVADLELNPVVTVNADPRIPETQHYRLQEVVVESNNQVTIAGQHFDIIRNGKGATWKYKGYHIFRFDSKGKKINDIILKLENKFASVCKLYKTPQGLVVTGTYTEDETKPEIKGSFIAKLDPATLLPTSVSTIAFTSDQLFNRDLDAAFPGIGTFYFHQMFLHPVTRKLYFIAENYNVGVTADIYYYQTVTYGGQEGISRKTDSWKPEDTYTYHNGDLLVLEMNPEDMKLNRHFLISKRQLEKISQNIENGYPGIRDIFSNNPPNDYIFPMAVGPLFSSYGLMIGDSKIALIYNEQPRKKESAQNKDFIPVFTGSPLIAATIDLKSGTTSTMKIADNPSTLVFMPRYVLSKGNEMYIPSIQISPKVNSEFKLTRFSLVQ